METPIEVEYELINQLRNRLKDLSSGEIALTNQELIRWLRARDQCLDKAELMFRNHISWRQQIGVKDLLQWKADEMFPRRFPFTISGIDFDGCPVVVFQVGRMDFRTAFEEGYLEEGLKYIYKVLERAVHVAKHLSADQDYMKQITAIVDCEGLQFRQLTSRKLIAEFIKVVGMFEANYPEILKFAIVVNVPSIFAIIYRVIVRILSTRTLSKVQLYDYNVSKYSSEILKVMAREEFPEKYGGTGLLSSNFLSIEEFLYSDISEIQNNGFLDSQ